MCYNYSINKPIEQIESRFEAKFIQNFENKFFDNLVNGFNKPFKPLI